MSSKIAKRARRKIRQGKLSDAPTVDLSAKEYHYIEKDVNKVQRQAYGMNKPTQRQFPCQMCRYRQGSLRNFVRFVA